MGKDGSEMLRWESRRRVESECETGVSVMDEGRAFTEVPGRRLSIFASEGRAEKVLVRDEQASWAGGEIQIIVPLSVVEQSIH